LIFEKLKRVLSAPYGLKNTVIALNLFAGDHLLTALAKTCEWMLHHRVVYGDNCGVVWVLPTTCCSQKAAHP